MCKIVIILCHMDPRRLKRKLYIYLRKKLVVFSIQDKYIYLFLSITTMIILATIFLAMNIYLQNTNALFQNTNQKLPQIDLLYLLTSTHQLYQRVTQILHNKKPHSKKNQVNIVYIYYYYQILNITSVIYNTNLLYI